MDIKKIFDLISSNNIDQAAVFALVNEAKSVDLNNDENIRSLIKKAAKLANKNFDKNTEDKIIQLIKKEGIGPNLFKFL